LRATCRPRTAERWTVDGRETARSEPVPCGLSTGVDKAVGNCRGRSWSLLLEPSSKIFGIARLARSGRGSTVTSSTAGFALLSLCLSAVRHWRSRSRTSSSRPGSRRTTSTCSRRPGSTRTATRPVSRSRGTAPAFRANSSRSSRPITPNGWRPVVPPIRAASSNVTISRTSSSARAISSRAPRRWPSPASRAACTIRSSSTAA
jgi:hypothetical protein